jgi:hypothetical protein
MFDVILIAVIVVFFAVAALVVRVLDRVVTGSADDVEADEEQPEDGAEPGTGSGPRPELPTGRPA